MVILLVSTCLIGMVNPVFYNPSITAHRVGITWDCTLLISETSGRTDEITFGESLEANDGPPEDIYDVVKPPTPLTPYLRAWCDDGLDAPYNMLAEDYRSYPDTAKTWNITIQWVPSDYTTPTTATLIWDFTELTSSEYNSINLYSGNGTFLVNMLIDTNYTFISVANIPQIFKIICIQTNRPPEQPSIPMGETIGYHNSLYSYSTSSVDPDGDELYYQFDWGNSILSSWLGPYPSGQTIQTSYNWEYPGTYQVKTHVKDNFGAQSSWSVALSVEMGNRPPGQPTSPSPQNGSTNVQISTLLTWVASDPDNDLISFDIFFGTTTPLLKIVENQSSLSFQTGTLLFQTTYYWRIIAWDGFGACVSSPVWFFTTAASDGGSPEQPPGNQTQPNTPPIAHISVSEVMAFIGTLIVFNASESYDPDGYIVRWFWEYGDGTTGNGEKSIHTYQTAGNYTVTLIVTDDRGTKGNETVKLQIKTANHPPTKPVVTGIRSGMKNVLYNYSVISNDPDNDFLQYHLSWGDGAHDASTWLPSGTMYFVTHTWNTSGKHQLSAEATDNYTFSESTMFDVFIDVIFIGTLGFLYDTDTDGWYDSLYTNATGIITKTLRLVNGSYLLDTDNNGKWDYCFNPFTESLSIVGSSITVIENQILFIVVIIVALIAIALIIFLYKKYNF